MTLCNFSQFTNVTAKFRIRAPGSQIHAQTIFTSTSQLHRTKEEKKKSENLKIPSCTKNKGKLYSSWKLVARMLNLSALPLAHKGSEVINCLCNVYFVQVYPLLITHTPVSKSGTYWLLTGSDCPGGKSVSFKWLVHFTGTVNLHTGNLQVVGTLGEGERRMHTGMIDLIKTRTGRVPEAHFMKYAFFGS